MHHIPDIYGHDKDTDQVITETGCGPSFPKMSEDDKEFWLAPFALLVGGALFVLFLVLIYSSANFWAKASQAESAAADRNRAKIEQCKSSGGVPITEWAHGAVQSWRSMNGCVSAHPQPPVTQESE